MSNDVTKEPADSKSSPIGRAEGDATPPALPDGTEPTGLEPLTMPLLGRMFAVPLLIIGAIVGGAVLVVLLFAGPAAPQPRTIEELVQALESTSGRRSLGLLLPREKELWQAAQELSVRLKDKDGDPELTPARLESLAERLRLIVKVDFAQLDRVGTDDMGRSVHSRRLEFLLRALARTQQPVAVDVLLEVLRGGHESYYMLAIKELAELHTLPETRAAIEPVLEVLDGTGEPETRLVACTALSVLATGEDKEVIEALKATHAAAEGEVQWSAALALGRLGSDAGRSTLMDLLDRSFLSSGDRYYMTDERGTVRRYPMPPHRVDQVMMAAIDASLNLEDAGIWDMIEHLKSDPSPAVRGRATAVMRNRI